MSLTASNMLPLEITAPEFQLINIVNDKFLDLKSLTGEYGEENCFYV